LGAQVRRTVGWRMQPVWSIKTMVRPSRRAFFYAWPVLTWPLGNRLLVAFTGTTLGFLGAPAQATQEMPDARGTIGDATVSCNDRREAGQGPERMAKAMSARPLAQEFDQVVALFETEFGLTTTGCGWASSPACACLATASRQRLTELGEALTCRAT
jgi:hypothetical protein